MDYTFRNLIEGIQERYNLNKREIAIRLGVTPSYLSRVITGMSPYNDTLGAKIAEEFPDVKPIKTKGDVVEEAIMNYMRSKAYTVYDMAERLNVPPKQVTETIAGGFDADTAELWSFTFGFSEDFLLRGEGQLMKKEYKEVPLLPVAAHAGKLSDFSTAVSEYECERIVSPLKDAEMAIPIVGESMYPELPSGSVAFIKKITGSFIEWGKPYVLDTINGVVVKYLTPGDNGSVRCVSANPNPMYAPFEIPHNEIFGIYRIVNLLCNK